MIDQHRMPKLGFILSCIALCWCTTSKAVEATTATQFYVNGTQALQQGDLSRAIQQWRRYLEVAPTSEQTLSVRKHLTVMTQEEARLSARQALSNEASLATQAQPNTIAVTNFRNLGSAALQPLEKGMAALIISDLAKVPALTVVERVKMQAILSELKLSASGVVAEDTVLKMQRLLRAEKVVTGNMLDVSMQDFQLTSSTHSVQQAAPAIQQSQGTVQTFYQLEKTIVTGIINDIGVIAVPASVGVVQTKNFQAFKHYSEGLNQIDNGQYAEAKTSFENAVKLDPQFTLASEALLATPVAALTVSQILGSVSNAGVTSAGAAGSAGVGGAAGSTTALSTALGSVSLGTVIGVGAAIAAVAGVAAETARSDDNGSVGTTGTSGTR